LRVSTRRLARHISRNIRDATAARAIIGLTGFNVFIDAWRERCKRNYAAQMLRWQAEMQRIEMLSTQRSNGN
jgi:hypothetical protein